LNERIRLTIEMVPQTSWYENLRKRLPRSEWDRIRKEIYARYDYRCAICKAEGRLSCHELWLYDDERHVQRLVGFVALCSLCHHVKHLGFATGLAESGRLDMERVIRHYMRVNGCTRADFENHRERAFRLWEQRSSHPWQVELDDYERFTAWQRQAPEGGE
jgi:hypothetical protein